MDVLQLDDIAAFDYNKTDNTVFHVLKKQMGKTPMLTEKLKSWRGILAKRFKSKIVNK